MSSIPSGMENASCNTVAFLSQKIMEKLWHTLVSFRSRTGPATAGGAMAAGENGVERAELGWGVTARLVKSGKGEGEVDGSPKVRGAAAK